MSTNEDHKSGISFSCPNSFNSDLIYASFDSYFNPCPVVRLCVCLSCSNETCHLIIITCCNNLSKKLSKNFDKNLEALHPRKALQMEYNNTALVLSVSLSMHAWVQQTFTLWIWYRANCCLLLLKIMAHVYRDGGLTLLMLEVGGQRLMVQRTNM